MAGAVGQAVWADTAPCPWQVLTGKGYDAYASDMWSMGICLFAMCAGFFPLDQASSVDWRYDRLKLALASDCSLAHSIFGFYDRQCTFSPEVCAPRHPLPLHAHPTDAHACVRDAGTRLCSWSRWRMRC